MGKADNSSGLAFMKMHGLGNDFVVIDQRGGGMAVTPALARALGDRHRGVGFDQLAVIEADAEADVRLTFWNADGSLSSACGNATRCIARYGWRRPGETPSRCAPNGALLAAEDAGDGLTR